MELRELTEKVENVRLRQNIRRAAIKAGALALFEASGNPLIINFKRNRDGGPGSGNFGHGGRPGEIGGSAPDGSADSKKSLEKVTKLKDGFKNLKPNQKCFFLNKSGIVPKDALDVLKKGVSLGDEVSLGMIRQYEAQYFNMAEYGRTVKSLECEERDRVASMPDDEAAAWAKKSMERNLEDWEKPWANPVSDAQKVAIDMGLFETPQVVSREDFDKYVEESGAPVCYRGLKDTDRVTIENIQFQMAYNTQEPRFGDGIFGDGFYFSTEKSTAESYQGRSTNIVECAIRPDAKVLEYGSPEHEAAKKRVQTSDDAIAAMCAGYDVIRKKEGGNEDYYIVLNRAAMVMVDPSEDTVNFAIKASEKTAAKR